MTLHDVMRLTVTAMSLIVTATLSAHAACTTTSCKNYVVAPGAKTTSYGVSAGKPTSYGVSAGKPTSYGVSAGKPTSYGVSAGKPTSYGVSAGKPTSYGVSAGKPTSYGVSGGKPTSTGVMGSNCHTTGYGVVCSDIRLKRDIIAVGRLENGLVLYRFRYVWSQQMYVGVMAHEVAAIAPEAVTRGADGYLRVDYQQLNLRLQTWDEWRATQYRAADYQSAL